MNLQIVYSHGGIAEFADVQSLDTRVIDYENVYQVFYAGCCVCVEGDERVIAQRKKRIQPSADKRTYDSWIIVTNKRQVGFYCTGMVHSSPRYGENHAMFRDVMLTVGEQNRMQYHPQKTPLVSPVAYSDLLAVMTRVKVLRETLEEGGKQKMDAIVKAAHDQWVAGRGSSTQRKLPHYMYQDKEGVCHIDMVRFLWDVGLPCNPEIQAAAAEMWEKLFAVCFPGKPLERRDVHYGEPGVSDAEKN